MTDTTLTPSRLWKQMTPDQKLRASRAFWQDEQATDDQVQAVMLIAQRKKFRAKSVIGLDLDRKARHFAGLAPMPETLAARALIGYHLAEQRPMMGAFLDALGITHENGLIEEENVAPDAEKIPTAAAALVKQFPADDVALYLNTLLCQDPETWKALENVPERAPQGSAAEHA